jgi:hypothetical protein
MRCLFVRIASLCVLLVAAASADGHELWFEPDGGGLVLYYGDFALNMHERSPGGNDRWGQLEAKSLKKDGEAPVAIEKLSDHFAVSARAGKDESLVAQDEYYRIFDEVRNGKAVRIRWSPATRWVPDFSARAPKLKLDIVPTGVVKGDDTEFQVFYKGEPLPEVPVQLQAQSGWVKDAVSDDDGKVRFVLPWKGIYMVRVLRYMDETPGVRNSELEKDNPLVARPSTTHQETYDQWSHTTSLSFFKRTGLAALPKPPETLPASMLAAPAPKKGE